MPPSKINFHPDWRYELTFLLGRIKKLDNRTKTEPFGSRQQIYIASTNKDIKHGIFVLCTQYSECSRLNMVRDILIVASLRYSGVLFIFIAPECENVALHIVDKIGGRSRCRDCDSCFEMGFLKCSMRRRRRKMALKS